MFKKSKKITKGMPSAVLLSIAIHAALFFLAGMLVVFTVVKKREIEFEPPKAVDRPKMKLKKPKVKVKKTSRPKPTTRIVTKMNRASMPDIQLPEMSGMGGEGLGDALGGFDMMPDFTEDTLFGGEQSIGNDFVGTFYDLKYDRRGNNVPLDDYAYRELLRDFIKDFDEKEFVRFARSPRKLYTTTFMMPPVPSNLGPRAFGEDTAGYRWAVVYKGDLVHKDGITFRFLGHGDNWLVIRVDRKIVFVAGWWPIEGRNVCPQWSSSSADSRKYQLGSGYAEVGDWITLEPDVPVKMEVLMAEMGGGGFASMVAVEEKGVEYEKNMNGAPILPIFKTAELDRDQIEAIYEFLPEDEVSLTNGPVFCDYGTTEKAMVINANRVTYPSFESELFNPEEVAEVRAWNGVDRQVLVAGFVAVIGDKVVLKDSKGRQRKTPLSRLSREDRKFVELASPPDFDISFSKQSKLQPLKIYPYNQWIPPKIFDHVFSAKIKQTSAGSYNHELHVEFFTIGEEVDGGNYILLDRQESSFTPTKENGRFHKLSGKPVEMCTYVADYYGNQKRGVKYGGYLVVIKDENGKIVDYGTSHKWSLDILGELRDLPVGKHFDKTGARVFPPRPKKITPVMKHL